MAYVDLNPVRAAIAQTPEQSSHTSIQRRVNHWRAAIDKLPTTDNTHRSTQSLQPDDLHPFTGHLLQPMPKGLIYNLLDYLQLVDWTGKQIRDDKIGAISSEAEPILNRLSISPEHWVYLCTHFESRFKGIVGSVHSLKQACQQFKRQRRPNFTNSKALFS